jgi:hypothetical protein
MTKRLYTGLLFLALGILLTGCSLPSTPTAAPIATAVILSAATPVPDRLPFEGMWMTEGDAPKVIVFTKDSMYLAESEPGTETYSRERFATVNSYDPAVNHISLRTQWIRINGTMRGFDSPNFTITYLIEGDTLRIGMGWEDQFATETEPLIYYRK